jgi:hypothetical protein
MTRLLTTLSLMLAVLIGSTGMSYARAASENDVATFYRSSVVIKNARYHIATFDSNVQKAGGTVFDSNWENCLLAAELFQSQQGVKTRFWCEKGFYKE